MKPLVTTSASGSPENSFAVFPLDGRLLIEQKNDSTTTLPERTADTFPPPIETCLVKESCVGDTESLVDFPEDCAIVTAYVLRRPNIHFEARRSLALNGCGTDCAWRIDEDYRLIVCAGQRLTDVHCYRQVVFPFPVAGCAAEAF